MVVIVFPVALAARRAARGVAPVMASKPNLFEVKLVILPAKEINRKHLAASAGFIQLNPMPP